MITVKRKLHFATESKGRQRIRKQPSATEAAGVGRVPRVSRLMALAIHGNRLIREGKIQDQTALAELLHVSQPRMTQIMNLLHLAPDIQEALLFLPRTTTGRDPIHEKLLRPIVAERDWQQQRGIWGGLRASVITEALQGTGRGSIRFVMS